MSEDEKWASTDLTKKKKKDMGTSLRQRAEAEKAVGAVDTSAAIGPKETTIKLKRSGVNVNRKPAEVTVKKSPEGTIGPKETTIKLGNTAAKRGSQRGSGRYTTGRSGEFFDAKGVRRR